MYHENGYKLTKSNNYAAPAARFFFNKSGYCEFSTPNLSNPDTEQLDPAIIRGHFHLLDPPI